MKKKTASGIILALLSISMLTLAFDIQASTRTSSDWPTGWSYRKKHVISSASGAGTNYQIKIKVHYGSGTDGGQDVYLNGHSQADFGDVRFTDGDKETLLDYWLEEKEDSDYAIFWVEVAGDLSSQNQTIYIYYGKSDATTISNGPNTFIFFDPCDNLSQWTKYTSGTGDVTIVDGAFRFHASEGSTNKEMIKSGLLGLSNVALHYRLKWVSPNSYTWRQWLTTEDPVSMLFSPTDAHGFLDEEHPSYQNRHYMRIGGVTKFNVKIGYRTAGQWDWITMKSVSGKQAIVVGDTVRDTQTQTHSWTDLRIVMEGGQSGTCGHERYVDDIFVRKFVDPEPSHGSWGIEEVPNPPMASFVFSPDEPMVADTVTFDASASNDPDGTIVSYAWDFGDGNTTTTADPIITHVYTLSGIYNVTLTVTDNYGLTDTAADVITVSTGLHDIAIVSVTPSPIIVTVGELVTIPVIVFNEGHFSEVFTLIVYHDENLIEVASVTLDASENATYTFDWDTTGVAGGTYIIKAEASVVAGETDTEDNMFVSDELVTVTSPPAPSVLSIKLSGEFDYGLREEVRVKLAALVRDVVTMEPVSNANVTVQIYDDVGSLRVSSVMVEKLAGTGIYEWTSSGTIKDLCPDKGVYLVRVQASIEDGPLAHDIVLFHIDPPAEGTNETLYYIALIAIVLTATTGLISKRQQIIKRLRRLSRHIANRTTSFLSFSVMDI